MIDERTDISTKKSSAIVVRYFVTALRRITIELFQGHVEKATALVIFDAVESAFNRRSIPFGNVIGFGSDGCNTMMGDNNSVRTRFEASCPDIYVSKCFCHSIHILMRG